MGGSATPTFKRTFLKYAGVAVLVLVAVASVAALESVRVARDQVRRQSVAGSELFATGVVAPLVSQGIYTGRANDLRALDDRVQIRKVGGPIRRVKVWSARGLVLYSDDPRQIGLRLPLDLQGSRALSSQGIDSTVADRTTVNNPLDQQLGESLEVNVGTRDTAGRPILVQTYVSMDRLDADQTELVLRILAVVLASLLGLGLLLVPVVYALVRRVFALAGTPPAGPGDDTR